MKVTSSTNDQLMVMAAHRYCLGRRSYIVSSCMEFLHDVWEDLTPNTQQVILRDTQEALDRGYAGDEMDERGWKRFVDEHPM